MDLSHITPLVLTFNEEPNLGRVLERLDWAKRVVVIDSGSTDRTVEIAKRHPNVDVVYRAFDEHANQWNFGLDQVATEWVLTLDSDYVLSPELVTEVKQLSETNEVSGYAVRFRYCIGGVPLRGTLYPPRVTLFRVKEGRYIKDGHTQRVSVSGRVDTLRSPIYHDDRKALDRWLRNQARYARLEARKLRSATPNNLSRTDRLRRLRWVVPLLTPFYCLFYKRLILDGTPGITYVLQRTYAEILLALHLSLETNED